MKVWVSVFSLRTELTKYLYFQVSLRIHKVIHRTCLKHKWEHSIGIRATYKRRGKHIAHKFVGVIFQSRTGKNKVVFTVITIDSDEGELHPFPLIEIHVIYMHLKFEKHLRIWWLLNILSGSTCPYNGEGTNRNLGQSENSLCFTTTN